MADGTPVEFNSLPALERVKLMTHGDGVPPYPGYVWDWDDPEPRWKPGEGVEDVHAGKAREDWLNSSSQISKIEAAFEAAAGMKDHIHLTLNAQGEIVAAYRRESRAQRDIDMVKKAGGVELVLKTLEIEE